LEVTTTTLSTTTGSVESKSTRDLLMVHLFPLVFLTTAVRNRWVCGIFGFSQVGK